MSGIGERGVLRITGCVLLGHYWSYRAQFMQIIVESEDSDFKSALDAVLVQSGYAEERAAKMGINDLLK